ncbi:uncharacterized protein N7483_013030 [Penicillium malachiteum]|uniref:uncharacterized protein n=1 Tax=Penicillium malachiteum TaxID=1324776 RepID=UPI002547EB5D|nr:uncharacterized protein N7483_013030 [Penicillium malachiteum]KAJ5715849.1 hypothetical protein N7483_013030 [Penicillium malachiteum]
MPTMHDRIRADILHKTRSLWTALTSANPPPPIKKLSNPDVVLMFPKMDALTLEDEEAFDEGLKPPFHRFDGYQLDDVRTIVIDLMAGTVTYKVRAVRGNQEYRATGSTTWSQAADGEWRLVVHQETLI